MVQTVERQVGVWQSPRYRDYRGGCYCGADHRRWQRVWPASCDQYLARHRTGLQYGRALPCVHHRQDRHPDHLLHRRWRVCPAGQRGAVSLRATA